MKTTTCLIKSDQKDQATLKIKERWSGKIEQNLDFVARVERFISFFVIKRLLGR